MNKRIKWATGFTLWSAQTCLRFGTGRHVSQSPNGIPPSPPHLRNPETAPGPPPIKAITPAIVHDQGISRQTPKSNIGHLSWGFFGDVFYKYGAPPEPGQAAGVMMGGAGSSRQFCSDRGRKSGCDPANAGRRGDRAASLPQRRRGRCQRGAFFPLPAVCGEFQRRPYPGSGRGNRAPCFARVGPRIFGRIPDRRRGRL